MAHTCKDCERRRLGCHATCPAYAAYDARNKQIQEARKLESDYRVAKMNYVRASIKKAESIR